jgi:RNA polymerase sigma factor (sigma-70 family)
MIRAEPQLVEAARSGDSASIARLLDVCQPDLARFARRTCATSQDAEDAVQLALWQVYRRVGALRTIATFGSWLFRIIERECFRLFRREGERRHAAPAEVLAGLEAPAVPMDLRIDLARAIAELPPAYREVLLLRDVDELTAPEAAAELGISIEAVKSRLHRARGLVREKLLASGYWKAEGP